MVIKRAFKFKLTPGSVQGEIFFQFSDIRRFVFNRDLQQYSLNLFKHMHISVSKFLDIQDAAEYLGVLSQTLCCWEKGKKMIPAHRTQGGQRRYSMAQLSPFESLDKTADCPTVAYVQVSSHDQKEDLQQQVHRLEIYCSSKGWSFSIIKNFGSGMNYNKCGLKQLFEQIMNGQIGRLVITHKDRLLRFGTELVFSLCAVKNVEIVIINQGDEPSFKEELAKGVLEMITIFSARLCGSRSHKQLIANLQNAVASV